MVTTSNIYLITNLINNKKYVGQTSNITQRWNRHKMDYKRLHNRYLYRAMNKYGFDNFKFEVLEEDIPIDNIHEKEIMYINKLRTKAPNGYNMTDGGEGSFNRIITEETRQKMRHSQKGRLPSEETKKKQSAANIKRFQDYNQRKKTSESHKNNPRLIEKAIETINKVNENMDKDQRLCNLEKAVLARSKSVLCLDIETNEILQEFSSTRKASLWIRENTTFIKACHTNISKVCRGKLDYVYGYKWIYKETLIEGATTISKESTLDIELPMEVPSILKG